MVPKGGRYATNNVQILGTAALRRFLSVVEREEIALLRYRPIQAIGRRISPMNSIPRSIWIRSTSERGARRRRVSIDLCDRRSAADLLARLRSTSAQAGRRG